MTIVLVDEIGGQRKNQRTFEQATVTIGRDASECHMVFDQSHSVSRRHAELRCRDGRWLLVDLNSSFGTFVNGRKIAEPTTVQEGAKLQFGTGGPEVVILVADAAAGPHASLPAAAVELIDPSTGHVERIAVSKPVMTIGRDPENDIPLDATAVAVSRRHAEIREESGRYALHDLGSFNGTFVNGQRITAPTPLYHDDRLQLGHGGPVFRFAAPDHPAPAGAAIANERGLIAGPITAEHAAMQTMVARGGAPGAPQQVPPPGGDQLQLLMRVAFGAKAQLSIGRAPSNDIHLDGLQISKDHARLLQAGGHVWIEDTRSTNGVHVNGARISQRTRLTPADMAQIGPFVFRAEPGPTVVIFDTRSKTRIDAVGLTKVVDSRSGQGTLKLLDDVAFTIRPNEFVGLLGPSGAGKSTLMDALNGMRRATTGKVLINDLDLYQHLDVLKQSIGYVPQDDIIHRELTVYRTLYYVAKLRLAADVTADEIDQIVNEVMDVTGLSERRDVPVAQLSGGQRKRVSIAVELITKPSVIFLDEPTSGLDPATEDRIMRLFRQIAESGRTIVLTTHAMENVSLFDRIAVLMRGKLVFYGAPHEALGHFGAGSFKDLYDKLEAPIEEKVAQLGPAALASGRYRVQREVIAEEVAEEWKRKFMRTEQFRRDVAEPVGDRGRGASVEAPTRERQRLSGAIRQWMTLSLRYAECLKRDRLTLLILLAQAPMISLLTLVVTGSKQPRDFPYFILAIVAIWFGTSVSSREIIRERGVYERERMVNLGLLPYVGSKVVTLSVIVGAQCVLLFGTLKLVDIVDTLTGAIGFSMPGVALGIPQFLVMALTGMVGVAVGLLISAVVRTSEMATSLVPLVLIPQIVFSGLIGVPTGVARLIGLAMPATWAFDEMKQLSGLGVLRDDRDGGLYREIERLNGSNMAVAREGIAKFGREKNRDLQSYEARMKDYLQRVPQGGATAPIPKAPQMTGLPSVPDPVRVPDDLSTYVDFKHPWMNSYLNPVVLAFMFFSLVLATLLALRFQDVK